MLYLKYLKYLVFHKYYVGIECFKKGLYFQGIVHDWSKFLPGEFVIYAKYFYGDYPSIYDIKKNLRNYFLLFGKDYKEVIEKDFNFAWLKHQHRSPHHWQHWVLRQDSGFTMCLDIPDHYITEMICDWIGAGKSTHGGVGGIEEAIEWYFDNKDKIMLSERTRKRLEVSMSNWNKGKK